MVKKWLFPTLLYTLLVIVWGAWVRISHSGDGCGASWPLCQGVLLPQAPETKTWIELTHRLMSGFYGLLILFLTIKSHKDKGLNQETRFWIKMSLLLTITEALLGAKLVLFGLVGTNDTPHRALVMALHFLNSLLLTGTLTFAWLYSAAPRWRVRSWNEIKSLPPRLVRRAPLIVGSLFLLIGLTGTVAALSNTLYPTDSLLAGLLADLDSQSHYLIRLRGLHPTLGFLLGTGLTILLYLASESLPQELTSLKNRLFQLSLGFGLTVVIGATTLVLHAPTALKLIHLLAAHTLWILLLMSWHTLRRSAVTDHA